jgi:NAD(P)H-dependent FMN reductase
MSDEPLTGNAPPPLRVGIIVGSTRPGRNGEAVARWVYEAARKRPDAEFEVVDLRDYPLPLFDSPVPPSVGAPRPVHARKWAEKVASLDAYVFVTPEYNHSTSGALKNAIDYLYQEWNNKAAGFVSYGSAGGVRAVEHLRLVMDEVQVATVRAQAWFSLFQDFEDFTKFRPTAGKEQSVNAMLDQLVAWGRALKSVRTPERVPSSVAPAAEPRLPQSHGHRDATPTEA